MLDYPGLSSPEVVAARRKHPLSAGATPSAVYADLIADLQPDWLVLRPSEVQKINQSERTKQLGTYKVAKVFDVSKQLDDYSFLPGRNCIEYDQVFLVFRKAEE